MSGFRNIQVLLSADSGNLKRGLAQGSAAVKAFDHDVKAANASQSALGMGLKVGLAAGAAAVAVGLGYAVVKAIEFDKAMRNTQSLTHISEGAFASLEAQVISMSTRLPQSAKILAEGLYDIASSGFQGADGLKILEASAQAASAGLSTTAVSARAITGVINAYGLSAADANYVSDVLFQTVNLGVVSFDELAGSIGDVLGGAAAAKVSIDQVGSAIATMTLAGIGGAEATTALNNLITKIIQPSEALAGAYKQLGYENGAAALKSKGLHGVLKDIQVVSKGNITTLLEYFPEIRAARGALALMANEGKNYNKVSAEIENRNKVQGATMRTLKEQLKGVGLQWELLKNNLDAAAISLGIKVLPTISSGIKGLQAFGQGVGDVIGKLSPLRDAALAVGQGIEALGIFVGPLVIELAKLAGTAAIAAILGVGKAIEFTGNLVKDHAQLVTLLAVAYGVHLLAALVAAQGGIGLVLWYNAGLAMLALRGGVTSVTTALYGLVTAETAATLGIAAIITLGLSAWNGYNDGVNKAEEATKAANAAMKSTNFADVKKGADEAGAAVKDMADFIQTQGSKSFFPGVFDVKDNMTAIAFTNNIEAAGDASMAAAEKVMRLRFNTREYLLSTTQLAGPARKAFADSLGDTTKLDAEVEKMMKRASAAGIDLSGSYADVKAKLDAYATSQTKVGKDTAIIDALGKMGDSAVSTADQVDSLKQAMDSLLGIAMGADEASDKWQASLDKLTETLKKNGKTLDGTTEKGRESKAAIRASTEGLLEHIIAQAKTGKSGADLSKMLTTGIKDLYEHADAAGFSRTAMQDLLTQYNLTPALVSTIVEAIGAGKSADEIKAMIEATAAVKGKTVMVNSRGQVLSAAQVKTLDDKITVLRGKIVDVKAKGGPKAEAEVKALQAQIDKLQPKSVDITVNANIGRQVYIGAGKTAALSSAYGNIFQSFADGGTRLPSVATIAKDGSNFVQWAEQGTGGEAFIPLSKDRRGRSTAILAQVAQMFGLSLRDTQDRLIQSFAAGGVQGSTAQLAASKYGRYITTDMVTNITGKTQDLVESDASRKISDGFDKVTEIIKAMVVAREALAKRTTAASAKVNAAEVALAKAKPKDRATALEKLAAARKEQLAVKADVAVAAASAKIANVLTKNATASEVQLKALADSRDALVERTKTATDTLQGLVQQSNDFAANIAATQAATATIASLFFESDGSVLGLANVEHGIATATQTAKEFAITIDALAKLGLDKSLLEQIIGLGPDKGGQVGQAILIEGQGAVDRLNELQGKLTVASEALGKRAAADLYGAGVAAAQGLVAGLESQQKAIEAQMVKIAIGIQNAIRRALDMHSPSRVMHGLGSNAGNSFAMGLSDTREAAAKAASTLAKAAIWQTTNQVHSLRPLPAGGADVARMNTGSIEEAMARLSNQIKANAAPSSVYVQSPFTGEYLIAKVAGVVDNHLQVVLEGAR